MSSDLPKFMDKSCGDDQGWLPNPGDEVSVQDSEQQLKDENQRLKTANLKLWTGIQQLRTDNHSLKEENQLMQSQFKNAMQPLNNLNQQWNANGVEQIDTTNNLPTPNLVWLQSDTTNNLPAIVLHQIFSHVTDTKTLLACRLVSSNWKAVIDNTAALMRKLTFNITHPVLFMDLTNIVPGVRSVKFDNIRPCTDEQIDNMIRTIAPTLESVTFNFDKTWNLRGVSSDRIRQQIRHLFSVVSSKCTSLKELRITGKSKEFLDGLSLNGLRNVTSLTLEVVNDTDDDEAVYKKLIRSLQKITNLTLLNSDTEPEEFDFEPVFSSVCKHMRKHPRVLQNFTYNVQDGHREYAFEPGSPEQNLWTKLYLIAGSQNVVVNTNMRFNLNDLILFDEKASHVDVTHQSCSTITKAKHLYSPNRNPTPAAHLNRTQYCTNLQELEILVCEDQGQATNQNVVVPDELSYLWKLKNLRNLVLTKKSGTLSESNFDGPVSAVRHLEVDGNVFDDTDIYSSISTYFPNLVDLILHSTALPEDLFICLAKLQCLVNLELSELYTLTDNMFLLPSTSIKIGIPATAPFASLKELKIIGCGRMFGLTDKCLLYGIQYISTLHSFTVVGCNGITEAGFAAIQAGRLNMTSIKPGEFLYSH